MSKVDTSTITTKKLFTKGNAKLNKDILTWSIPASKEVCGRECAGCYAIKEQNRWNSVRDDRDWRYEFSKSTNFVDVAVDEIKKYGKKYVRVHAAGEFYSQEYINKWVEIAKDCPSITFYSYTKRMGDFDFSELMSLQNFVLHNSYVEIPFGAVVNYGEHGWIAEVSRMTNGFICPLATDRTGGCGSSCTWCMEKKNEGTPILFDMH